MKVTFLILIMAIQMSGVIYFYNYKVKTLRARLYFLASLNLLLAVGLMYINSQNTALNLGWPFLTQKILLALNISFLLGLRHFSQKTVEIFNVIANGVLFLLMMILMLIFISE